MKRFKKPAWQKSIARERIDLLFEEADKRFEEKPDYSHRYVNLAREIGMRYRVRLPKELKRKYCKHCHKYLKPGVNAKIRFNQKRFPHIVITCEECGGVKRIPYKK